MTVSELERRLKTMREHGCGDQEIQAWDPDSEQWEQVTCITYNPLGEVVRIYTDEL